MTVVSTTNRATPWVALAAGLILLALVAAPKLASEGTVSMLTEFLYYLALAQLWNLLAGYAGVVSLGQHAFLGVGGYVLFALVILGEHSPLWAIGVAAVAGGVLALPVAWIVFRLRGPQLAIGSWVVAEFVRLCIAQWIEMGGGAGISLPADAVDLIEIGGLSRDTVIYAIALLLCLAVYVASYLFLLSRNGLALTAIRDNEIAARSCGISIHGTRWIVFIATAIGTAAIGALIYLSKFRISPGSAFDINWTSYAIFIVVIGGVGTLEGPIVGTIVFFLLREYFSHLGSWYVILLGSLAVLVMLKMPKGLWGTVSRRWAWQLFPTSRRLLITASDPEPAPKSNTPNTRDAAVSTDPAAT